ncbi:Adenylate cyclase [Rasamsonia emersonii CBS 393.64]|uniref:Adenylate cyclase n=1 Tax=Rasamsonia emersonii (strain ATCC 16479 / CBS 393.64 / IMI 116815) TaxID=1408163 RepID=A0A0F4Z047_RASE3|nr:Adenylate cyclase [Rasamsonia emersonii CBS 393.64]KKA23902.1 Adenylate cyclase [Rasamsonia emersonii CBS 393.64]
MARPEDTIRAPRQYGVDAGDEDEIRITPESSFYSTGSNSGPSSHEDESPKANRGTGHGNTGKTHAEQRPPQLSQEEIIELARRAVESGIQETKRSLAGSEAVSDVVRPKLTIDLGHSNIGQIPEAVVDIIKDEVERLSLSNNQLSRIPYRFSECAHLRYLNIRANNFREFPKGVYLSRNKISKIPDEIRQLTSLRVFSIMQNRLDDLPAGLADMNKLQILKVAGNFLKYPLRRVLEAKESEVASLSMTDTEREVAVTAEVKKFLKARVQQTTPEPESGSDASEILVDTPKPVKRGANSRFPVIPSTGDGSSDPRSPSFSRPPPIPMRSHQRLASGQNSGYSRPGVSHQGSNERNRSNSEGVLPMSARNKRMGLVSRKTDLSTLDEMRPYRNSHLRGLSHGSILRTNPSGGASGSGSSSPGSPRGEPRRVRDTFVRRMSSLPEHKEEKAQEPIIEGAKGILFSLFQIHPHISTLINVIKGDDARRNSLEIVFYNASTHVDQLNEALENVENMSVDDRDFARMSNEVKRECVTCLMAYTHVGTLLRQSVEKIIANGDARYVRSLLLMVYGSLLELRNACINLGAPLQTRKQSQALGDKHPQAEAVQGEFGPDRFAGPAVTPTREKAPPMRRLRSDTTIQHPQGGPGNSFPSTSTYQPSTLSPVSTPNSVPLNYGGRSRSNSRSATVLNTSVPSSLATPRSGESFPPIPSSSASRINPVTGMDELEEDPLFEKIFKQLTSAYHAALHALPLAYRQFTRCLEMAEEAREPEEVRRLWNNLIRRCRTCYECSEALGDRLSTMKVKEPGGGVRNQREFWQLCKSFMQSFVDLVTDMRDARNLQLLPTDVIAILRPVQKASREAGRLIEASPWSYLADMSTAPNAPGIYGPPLQPQNPQHHPTSTAPFMSNGTPIGVSSSTSPQSVPLPATPLSAALGPAAQATVPSTPVSAYSDKFFAGDVFQRADSLLAMQNQAPYLYRR